MKKTPVVLVSVAAVAALAGCEKPQPAVSAFSGTHFERTEPICYSTGGNIDAAKCLQDAIARARSGDAAKLEVVGGNTVGISVDPPIADAGWNVSIQGQPISQQPIKSTYYRFQFPQGAQSADGFPMAITVDSPELKGVWAVRLDPSAGTE